MTRHTDFNEALEAFRLSGGAMQFDPATIVAGRTEPAVWTVGAADEFDWVEPAEIRSMTEQALREGNLADEQIAGEMADWTEPKPIAQSKHTPGPWTYEDLPTPAGWPQYTLGVFDTIGAQRRGGYIAEVMCHTTADVTQANARLIAAAPELLHACQGLLAIAAAYAPEPNAAADEIIAVARAAIAKATGGAK